MSGNLRQIVRNHIEIETLKEYLGSRYLSVTVQEKEELLNTLRNRGEIDREIENVLNAFLHEIQKNSPDSRKRKIKAAIFAALNLLLTIGIAYAVNETAWVFVTLLAIANVVVIVLPLFFED